MKSKKLPVLFVLQEIRFVVSKYFSGEKDIFNYYLDENSTSFSDLLFNNLFPKRSSTEKKSYYSYYLIVFTIIVVVLRVIFRLE